MTEIIFGATVGLLGGFAFNRLAAIQINNRCSDKKTAKKIGQPVVLIIWLVICATVCAYLFTKEISIVNRILSMAIALIAISVSAVDWLIRKIPNESLLLLLAITVLAIFFRIFSGQPIFDSLISPLIGSVIGLLIYLIPSFFHVPIGAGDIKYCTVIGFMLGLNGFLQTAIIMAVALMVYLVYLLITKKGNLKTATPMGPFLSLGVIITLMVPVASYIR